ncbi:TonB-dependent receptor [Nitrospirillum sp. BR 11752]|uniref:TonB-dependent receptor n=1 Tax=Nitrospirillum sp. BR 11752 TaxID=3104293 RepID=UPI002E9AF021|nr:TonB-dependent receptor [Nitrospirillum sp. BR 11752]
MTTHRFSTACRLALLTGCALVALRPAPALAQTAGGDDDLQEITITGQRTSNLRATAVKRDAVQVLDAVSADETGTLPDFNVADALKRVAGVNVLIYQGEPRFVTIRGFDANYDTVTIDGFTFATPDSGGRQVYMETLPSNLAQRMEVYKSGSPDLDGHAVGGVVNLVTPSAFDFPDGTTVVSAKGGYNLQRDDAGGRTPAGEGQVRSSWQFGRDDQFGLLVSASYWERDIFVPQEETAAATNWYQANGKPAATAYGGNGIAVPAGRLWYNYQDDRRRLGTSARLDWKPSPQLSAHLSSFYYYQHETAVRNDLNAAVNAGATDAGQTETSGTLSSVNQYAQRANLNFTRKLWGVNSGASYTFAGDLVADLGGSWSRALLDNPQIFDRFTQSNLAFTYDTSGDAPLFTAVDSGKAHNWALYNQNYRQFQDYQLGENVFDVQASLSRHVGPEDRGLGFKVGAKWVGTRQTNSLTQTTYNAGGYTLADAFAGRYTCGYTCNDGGIPLISQTLVDQAFWRSYAKVAAAYAGSAAQTSDTASALGGDYRVSEDIYAGYGLLAYTADWGRLQAGARVEGTRFTSDGYVKTNGVIGPATSNKSYTTPLPSVTGMVHTGDDSQLRLAYSRTLGRPRYSDQATHGGSLSTTGAIYTLSQGNPNLKPRLSDNIDVAEEWYLDHGRGLVSLGGYYKTIHNEIFTFTKTETLPVNGVNAPVNVSEARNSPHDAIVKGLEFNFIHDFDFLPEPLSGFGIAANGMMSWTSFPIILGDGTVVDRHELPQQANRVFNVSLYYEGEKLHGRIAWNHTGRMWDDRYSNLTGAAVYYQNRDYMPADRLDLQLSYDVSRMLSISVTVQNLTGEDVRENDGRDLELGRQYIGFAPTVMLGAALRF